MKPTPRTRAPGTMLEVVIYIRVSTDEQALKGISLDVQPQIVRDRLDAVYGAGNYRVVEVLVDDGHSGATGPDAYEWALRDPKKPYPRKWRPAMIRLFEYAESGAIDVVAVYDLSRLYRKRLASDLFFDKVLQPMGIALVAATEEYDNSTPAGRLQTGVMGSVAEFQRLQGNERIGLMLNKKKESGQPLGTPGYGWRWSTPLERAQGMRKTFLPIPEQIEHVRRVKELYLSGHSEAQVARILNAEGVRFVSKQVGGRLKSKERQDGLWDAIRVRIVLRNPANAGLIRLKDKTLIEGWHHEHRAYEREDYERIERTYAERRRRPKGVRTERAESLLTGIAFCGACGSRMMTRQANGLRSLTCRGYLGEERTRHAWVRAEVLERSVLHEVARLSQLPEVLRAAEARAKALCAEGIKDAAAELARLRDRQAELEQRRARARDLMLKGIFSEDDYLSEKKAVDTDLPAVLSRISELEAGLKDGRDAERCYEGALEALRSFEQVWGSLDNAERHELLRTVVERLEVRDSGGNPVMVLKLRLMEEVTLELARGNAPKGAQKTGGGPNSLTTRELAALWYLLEGFSPSEGAERMGLTRSTFSTLTGRAARRLGVCSGSKAARKAEARIRALEYLLPLSPGDQRGKRKHSALKATEAAVLEMQARGYSVEQTAGQLGITPERVRVALESAQTKATGKRNPSE